MAAHEGPDYTDQESQMRRVDGNYRKLTLHWACCSDSVQLAWNQTHAWYTQTKYFNAATFLWWKSYGQFVLFALTNIYALITVACGS